VKDLASAARRVLAQAAEAPGLEAVPVPPGGLVECIEQTLLRPDGTEDDFRAFCEDASERGFRAVCVPPVFVPLAASLLAGQRMRVGTVVGFPFGSSSTATKIFEIRDAAGQGAVEVDAVLHVGSLRGGDHDRVAFELSALAEAAHGAAVRIKIILETSRLTDEEKAMGALLSREAGVDFVKTGTGFGPGGATVHDVRILRAAVGDELGVKAAGGIRTYSQAISLLQAGATRLGTSSGAAILEEAGAAARAVAAPREGRAG
jgi:deoxyribose-phosphate aldolase